MCSTQPVENSVLSLSFFFFQAEDGIRDTSVTGVQTCALPIWSAGATGAGVRRLPHAGVQPLPGPERGGEPPLRRGAAARAGAPDRAARESLSHDVRDEIGRASCRERV